MYGFYGGSVGFAGELIHGKTTPVWHDGVGLFEGVPQGIECTRYHSLAGHPDSLPACLIITSKTESGIVMGVRHKDFVMEGVQFHPESVSSEGGRRIFANFLSWKGPTWSSMTRDMSVYARLDELLIQDRKRAKVFGRGLSLESASKLNSTGKQQQTILQQISRQRLLDVAETKLLPGNSIQHLQKSLGLGLAPSLLSFYDRLVSNEKMVVLAEIKRASPSKGKIAPLTHAPTKALEYANAGASAVSVLTEPTWFHGSLDDMLQVRLALEKFPNRPAVLRKDFIVDPYQIYEARLHGADTFLLIVAILTDVQISEYLLLGRQLGMEALVEVANSDEMKRAVSLGSKIIGINNRDLHTFKVDMNRTSELAQGASGQILLALSGIQKMDDALPFHAAGVSGVLVGEALMRSSHPAGLIHSLRTLTPSITPLEKKKPLIKMCGMTRLQDVKDAINLGADFIGFIFEPSSARYVEPTLVKSIISSCRVSQEKLYSQWSTSNGKDWFASNLKSISQKVTFVGVFTTQTIDQINAIVDGCGLDLVQFHGPRPHPELSLLIRVPVIQAINLQDLKDDHLIDSFASQGVSFVLLDAAVDGKTTGGTGKSVDWKDAQSSLETLGHSFFLAGGLTPQNVKEAIQMLKPAVLDVSSGIESSKGIKSLELMQSFISAVRQ